jgi:DNA-binding NtrC family response regulator
VTRDGESGATLPIDTAASSGPEGPAVLVVAPDGLSVHPIPTSGSIVLGRGEDADVRLGDPSISRLHARLEIDGLIRVTDLGSANGVTVRGTKIPRDTAVPISPGEPVQLGAVSVVVQSIAPARDRGWVASGEGRSVFVPEPGGADELSPMIAADPATRDCLALAERVAPSSISVLLTGETGVGKEVVARRIHEVSRRAGPFLGINCAALSTALLESELFGHERGAFTGADRARPGLFESADRGTVFLDEIGEMPLALQAKLLRVLEQREVMRVGGRAPIAIDVRFVAATNRDLRGAVRDHAFRADLYYRVAGVDLEVPALRDRPADVEPLALSFLSPARCVLSDAALAALEAHDFPGNVRELRHALERAAVVAGDGAVIEREHLPPEIGSTGRAKPRPSTPPSDERERILWALEKCAHNQTRAAEVLGISRRTLVSRIKAYRIPRPRKGYGED